MIVRIGRKKFNVFAWDIETHNDEETKAKGVTSMWLGCLINEDSKINDSASYHYTMDEFINIIDKLSNPLRKHGENKPIKNVLIYVYNLSFEYSFLLPVLLQHGFKFKEEIETQDEYVYNSVTTKSVSSAWQVQLKFGKNNGIVILRDLAKIYGGGLGKVAKSFGLPTQKGEIDYTKNRLHNYAVTDSERFYCFNDTRIIIDILLEMVKREDKNFFKAISMASYSMQIMLKMGYPRSTKPYAKFRNDYPFLNEEETNFLRNAVSGGITYAPSNWQFKVIDNVICHIDAHSMHPSSAYKYKYPYGTGEYGKGMPIERCQYQYCCHVKVSYDDVILHSVIKLIGIDSIEDYDLYLWDFEIDTMKRCYVNLQIEYIDYYRYKTKPLPWRKFYAWCFNNRLEAKKQNNSFNVLYYKLLMNSSYGKLLERPHLITFMNVINCDGIIDSEIVDKIKPNDMTDEQWAEKCNNAKYTYIPVGATIPAHSRCTLIDLALKISPSGKDIVYFDTDSIFFIWNQETKANFEKYTNTNNFLGGWAIEEFLTKAQFTAPKRYKTIDDKGNTTFKMGGFNLNLLKKQKALEMYERQENETDEEYIYNLNNVANKITFPFEEINIVNSSYKVQRAYRVKGGTIIDFQTKEIKIPPKYATIYNRNIKQ